MYIFTNKNTAKYIPIHVYVISIWTFEEQKIIIINKTINLGLGYNLIFYDTMS